MRAIITGNEGYVGSKMQKALEDMGIEVFGIDLKSGLDITSYSANIDADVFFHMAALPSVEFSVKNPDYTMKHNVLGTSKALSMAVRCGVKRFIFSSSAAADESHGNISSPYGLHKRISEMECELYSRLYGLDTVSLRYFNIFSEDQKYGGAYSTVISAWMEMARLNKGLRVDGDGMQTRDFIHVDDIVDANIFCMNREGRFEGLCYDVGTGSEMSILDLKEIVESARPDLSWEFSDRRVGDIYRSCSDKRKSLSSIGWFHKVDVRKSIFECFK